MGRPGYKATTFQQHKYDIYNAWYNKHLEMLQCDSVPHNKICGLISQLFFVVFMMSHVVSTVPEVPQSSVVSNTSTSRCVVSIVLYTE